jgi:hypothetical protein
MKSRSENVEPMCLCAIDLLCSGCGHKIVCYPAVEKAGQTVFGKEAS